MPNSKTFYIIDGHAHIYRAYFAPFRDLTSPVTGEPTKATYVFTQMLLNLIDQRKPDYLAMLIASMARELCEEDFEIFLVSKDKDLRQTLTPCVHMYDPATDEVIDEKKLEDKVGYSPREAVEVQTLMGDAIDNVPGIPGVGEKTAAKLIKKYGSAEAVLSHLDELTPKMRENFQAHGDRIPIARRLVT